MMQQGLGRHQKKHPTGGLHPLECVRKHSFHLPQDQSQATPQGWRSSAWLLRPSHASFSPRPASSQNPIDLEMEQKQPKPYHRIHMFWARKFTLTMMVMSRRGVRGYQLGRGLFLFLGRRRAVAARDGCMFSLSSIAANKLWIRLRLEPGIAAG